MPRARTPEELRAMRRREAENLGSRRPGPRVVVGMGTCGIAAGAREVMHAILDELQRRGVDAEVSTAGCAGACAREPLVTIETPGQPRVTYGNVDASVIARLVDEHLLQGRVVRDLVVDL